MNLKNLLQPTYFYTKALDRITSSLPINFTTPYEIGGKKFLLYVDVLIKYIEILRKIQALDQKNILQLQEKKLSKILNVAYTTSWWHYYLGMHVQKLPNYTFQDLNKIPPINRNHLVDVPKERFLTSFVSDSSIIWRRSGGSSTGTPIKWGIQEDALVLNNVANTLRALQDLGFTFSKQNTFKYLGLNYTNEPQRTDFKYFSLGNFSLAYGDPMFASQFEHLHTTLKKLNKRSVVRTTPGGLLSFTQELKHLNIVPPIGAFVVVGNVLDEHVRQLASQYFSCPITAYYGTQEFGSAGILCPDNPNHYHILSERVIVEILNDTGEQVKVGESGHVTVTCLDNIAMPLLRYQPGDIGKIQTHFICNCRNNSPLLEILQRSSEFIQFSNGGRKSAWFLLRFFSRDPFINLVRRFQIIQTKKDAITIILEIRSPISPEALRILEESTLRQYGESLQLEVRQVSKIDQTTPKFRVFIPLQ